MGNHNSGRRPQPTSLKVLRGNPGKRPLNDAEPLPPPEGEVAKPAWLSEGAGRIWDEVAPLCMAMKTLMVTDVRPFSAMCELIATFDENTKLKGTAEFDTRLERETATSLRPYFAMFGMEPMSRSKIRIPKAPDAPESKWAGVLK